MTRTLAYLVLGVLVVAAGGFLAFVYPFLASMRISVWEFLRGIGR